MPDHEKPNARGLFGGVFARGGVEAGDAAWLQAMLDAEAGLARALERAGLAPAGAGEAVTAAASAGDFNPNELGGLAALTGNPVPGLARALARQVPQTAVSAVHRGATSQDIVDTAAMLLAKRAIGVIAADLARAADAAAGLAAAHRDSIMIGRTLLQQAVPVTFGLVAAGWLTSLDEARAGLDAVGPRLAVQFGGAAGTLASLGEAGQRVTGLLATLAAASEQELQRAAGAWHAEWEPLTALFRLTGSASSWAADLLPGLVVDTSRMAANLAATKGLPLAEHVSSLLAGVLGGAQAHDLVAEAGARATSAGLPLRDVLLAVPKLEQRLSSAGITAEQIDSALEPSGYLGAAGAFVTAALDAHKALEARHG